MRPHSSPELMFLDPSSEVRVEYGRDLPHWSQAGVVTFITWRTWDSMPAAVLTGWLSARNQWLRRHGIDPDDHTGGDQVRRLPSSVRAEYRLLLSDRWEAALDAGHGSCPLRDPGSAGVVADSFRHFDGVRYTLLDFVVMPNHVHLLAAFAGETGMAAQCESWKHFTAVRLSKRLGRAGRFWLTESFDHLVRSEDDFVRFRQYIADNPSRARLRPREFVHYSRPLS